MPLPSFFQRKAKAPKSAAIAEDTGPVQEARVRARRRLIGAVVLLAAGIVGFPLLFETKPRPMPVDIPIDMARNDGPVQRPARVLPPPVVELPADAGNETPATPSGSAAQDAPAAAAAITAPAGTADDKKSASAAPSQPSAPAAKPAPPVIKPAAPAPKPSAPVSKPTAPTKPVEDAPRAKPAVEPKPAAAAASADLRAGRFVVQVGAYTDLGAMRDARQRVEKQGFKTYTQEVDTPSGRRTRLRVGPFTSRDEAEAAGARLKAIGMPGNLLVL